MKIHSKTYDREFEVALCPSTEGKEEFNVISHKSLQDIVDVELRGNFSCDFAVLKDAVGHALVKCVITDTKFGYTVAELGEKTKAANENEIGQQFPVTSAYTRAFDRAVIRLMGFEGKFYSNEEMNYRDPAYPIQTNSVASANNAPVPQEVFSEDEYDEPVSTEVTLHEPDYQQMAEEDGPAEEDLPATAEPNFSEESTATPEASVVDADETGDYVLDSGGKKGQKLRDIYNSEGGKSWLDFYLGGRYGKAHIKKAIVQFYLANDIEGPKIVEGNSSSETAKKVYDELVAELTK